MNKLIYAMRFAGQAKPQNDAGTVLKAATRAPSSSIRSTVRPSGLAATIEPAEGDEATFESEVKFSEDGTFAEEGVITFGAGNTIRFDTVGRGYLGPSRQEEHRHGCVCWRILSGKGQFARASGLITSNFTVGPAGEVTDHHFGIIFIE